MSFEQFYVRSRDGTAIHCYSHGQGMPLVLVHGLQRCADIWFPLIGRLPGCFKLVMPNLRGRSGSGRPVGEDSYLLERFVDDLEAVVNSSGPAVMLLGW